MCAEALTQDEIDALLRGETPPPKPPSEGGGGAQLTPDEEDALTAYAQIVCESGGEVSSTLLGEETQITLVGYKETDPDTIAGEVTNEIVLAQLNFSGMLQGQSAAILQVDQAQIFANQMMGGGSEGEFGDLEESAMSEAFQQLFSAANTKLAQQAGGEIQLETPDIYTKPDDIPSLLPESGESLIQVEYQIQSSSLTGPLYQIIPKNLLEGIVNVMSGKGGAPMQMDQGEEPRGAQSSPDVLSSPAQFVSGGTGQQTLDAMQQPGLDVDTRNLELILDISLDIRVELGRTNRKIRDVLEMGPGSVIELERLAGEPVDILVNDKLFAKGEVVVIDENFGVRITDILTIQERIEALK